MASEIPLSQRVAALTGLHDSLATCHPSLKRGVVWCRTCGSSRKVDSADCLRHGWPKCHGATMTIDSPAEQAALSARGL